jgi:hypothetical protein
VLRRVIEVAISDPARRGPVATCAVDAVIAARHLLRPIGPAQGGQLIAMNPVTAQRQVGRQSKVPLIGPARGAWPQHLDGAQQAQPSGCMARPV